jgi:hypothetical protein
MSVFIVRSAVLGSAVELEDGLGNLLLENGDELLLESSDIPAAGLAVAILDENPVLAIPYSYWLPFFAFQMEPVDQVNPVYAEAWQNQSTTLMPERTYEELYGPTHQWQAFFQQIAPPVFLPDGTGVTPPTRTKLSPGVGSGRTSTKRV